MLVVVSQTKRRSSLLESGYALLCVGVSHSSLRFGCVGTASTIDVDVARLDQRLVAQLSQKETSCGVASGMPTSQLLPTFSVEGGGSQRGFSATPDSFQSQWNVNTVITDRAKHKWSNILFLHACVTRV